MTGRPRCNPSSPDPLVLPRLLLTARDTLLPRALAPLLPGVTFRGPHRDAEGHPLLFLTVDDGPHSTGTPRWLQILATHDAKATFFLSDAAVSNLPGLVKEMARQGHGIANHGGEHVSAWSAASGRVLKGFVENEKQLSDLLGRDVSQIRPPYGRLTPGILRWARECGNKVVLWDLLPGDFYPDATASRVADEIVARARPGSIVVLHDGPPADIACDALDVALPLLAAAGWRFPALPTTWR